MLEFLNKNWLMISLGLTLVLNILNALTKHYSEKKGLSKGFAFLTEMVSFVQSYGNSGKFKLPLQSKKPEEKKND